MPTAAIGADAMVGFPGETVEKFEETRRFVEEPPFTYLHCSPTRPVPGLPRPPCRQQVPVHVARERNRVLRDLAAEKNLEFRRKFVGQTLDVITLQAGGEDWTEALSDNYLKVRLAGRHGPNTMMRVRIAALEDDGLLGIVPL